MSSATPRHRERLEQTIDQGCCATCSALLWVRRGCQSDACKTCDPRVNGWVRQYSDPPIAAAARWALAEIDSLRALLDGLEAELLGARRNARTDDDEDSPDA